MTCYHPLIREVNKHKLIRAKDGHKYYEAKVYNADKYALEMSKDTNVPGAFEIQLIPCGKCIGCRLDYSREWANRAYLESKMYKQNWFVTLTYDEDHIHIPEYFEDRDGFTWTNPNDESWTGNLMPKDLQQFLKNIRQIKEREWQKEIEKCFSTKKEMEIPRKPNIRFIACGEYGSETFRPHYHLILFNLELNTDDLYKPKIINKELYYQSKTIERAWKHGISNVSEATWNTMAYTARYITKKINGPESEQLYAQVGKQKEFFRASNRPGIGEPYYKKYKNKIYANDEIIIKNKQGSIASRPPKYFDKLYEKENQYEFLEIKRKRKELEKQRNKINETKTSLLKAEQLEIEERTKEEQSVKLQRAFEKNL